MKRRKKWQPHHRQKPRKKTERGNSRQVLKMELRNMTFGEEELSCYHHGCGRTPPSAYQAEEPRLHLCGLPPVWEPEGKTVYQLNQECMVH